MSASRNRSDEPARVPAIPPQLRQSIRYIVARRIPADWVDDVVQDVLLAVSVALQEGRLVKQDRLGAFVRGTALRVMSNWLRRRRRRETEPLDPSVPADGADALDMVVEKEDAAAMASRLQRLRPRDRELLRMIFYEGRTAEEIAAALNVSLRVVRQRKSRALARLRQLWLKSP